MTSSSPMPVNIVQILLSPKLYVSRLSLAPWISDSCLTIYLAHSLKYLMGSPKCLRMSRREFLISAHKPAPPVVHILVDGGSVFQSINIHIQSINKFCQPYLQHRAESDHFSSFHSHHPGPHHLSPGFWQGLSDWSLCLHPRLQQYVKYSIQSDRFQTWTCSCQFPAWNPPMALLPGWNKSQKPSFWPSATFWDLLCPPHSLPSIHHWPQCKFLDLPSMFSSRPSLSLCLELSHPKCLQCLLPHFLPFSAQKDLHCIIFYPFSLAFKKTQKTK